MPPLTILVVEDHREFRRFVCLLLKQRAEVQIEVASDGLEAVEKARRLQPKVILLDIGLPNLDGMEVARRVRKSTPSTRILFVSGLADPDVVREALRLGSGYVHKPSVQEDLLPAIEATLRGEPFVSREVAFDGADDRQDDGISNST